ncbi:antibiotic biosynthesis monooxygenase [Streptomyces sp. NPDC050564]|uniref:antibiotic biosynthesis monooxygenase n=1 Tax=Streptomyces sp. NPDC050564 TaxID=3365631 RepID=UPI0037B53952
MIVGVVLDQGLDVVVAVGVVLGTATTAQVVALGSGVLRATTDPQAGAFLGRREVSRIFFEIYADRAAFDEHERQPHTLRFLSERTRYVEKTDVDWLEPYAGKYPNEAAK